MGIVYSLHDALVSINVPTEKAKAVIDAMEREMMDKIATKADLTHAQAILSKDMDRLEERMKSRLATLETRLTLRLGSIGVVLTGILFGLLKLTS